MPPVPVAFARPEPATTAMHAALQAPTALRAVATFGPYKVFDSRMQEGGGAHVYRALDPRGHTVAIKVGKNGGSAVLAEAAIMRAVGPELGREHDWHARGGRYLTRLEGTGEALGASYIAVEHARGTTVAQAIGLGTDNTHALPEHTAVTIAINAARGLAVMHERGYLHGDIHPKNIMADVANPEHTKVIDYDFAHPLDADGKAAISNADGNWWGYRAPECYFNGGHWDRTSDIFALAAVLQLMLTGRQPLVPRRPAATPTAMQRAFFQVAAGGPRGEGVHNPKLRAVLEKAMQALAADRYQSMSEFADALAAATR